MCAERAFDLTTMRMCMSGMQKAVAAPTKKNLCKFFSNVLAAGMLAGDRVRASGGGGARAQICKVFV